MNRARSFLLSAFFLATGILASPAWAQTAIQPGTIVGTFNAQGYIHEGTLLTVPGDRAARITDVLVTNYAVSACSVSLTIGSTFLIARVPPDMTLVIPLNSGYGLVAGSTAGGGTTNCATNSIWTHFRGFYFTVP